MVVKKENKKETSYRSMTDDEIKQLADDIYRGRVFTDRHVQNPDDIPRVFIPLVLIDDEQREELNANPPGLIYEYMDRAGPLAMNGMPMFYSLMEDGIRSLKSILSPLTIPFII